MNHIQHEIELVRHSGIEHQRMILRARMMSLIVVLYISAVIVGWVGTMVVISLLR